MKNQEILDTIAARVKSNRGHNELVLAYMRAKLMDTYDIMVMMVEGESFESIKGMDDEEIVDELFNAYQDWNVAGLSEQMVFAYFDAAVLIDTK